MDSDSLCLRVGGRLKHANLSHDEKYPYILSPKSSLAKLIVRYIHLKSLHGSNQLTLSLVREFLWIPNARNLVKTIISQCVRCVRFKAKPITQMMGNLPKPRVIQSMPFSHVGIDYAGPIKIRPSSGRGRISVKGYIVVFVCFTTKAVHLEAVSSYDTAYFMNAFEGLKSAKDYSWIYTWTVALISLVLTLNN